MTMYHAEHLLRFQTPDGRHPLAVKAFELHQAAAARQGQVWSATHAAAFRELHQAYVLTALGAGQSQRTAWPLAVGTGKTQSLVAFARAQSMTSKPMSLLVCIESVEHISHLHRDMIDAGVPAQMVAVFHSKTPKEVATEGLTPSSTPEQIDQAPFLIATHSRMLRGADSIARVNTYKGNPRQLIVWDESLIKSQGHYCEIVDVEQALGVLKPVAGRNVDSRDAAQYISQAIDSLREFYGKISNISHIKTTTPVTPLLIQLPPLSETDEYRYRCALDAALPGLVGTLHATARRTLADFLEHCQRPLRVLPGLDNGHDVGVIHFETIIPETLRRLIVLDASHNIRALTKDHDTTLRTTTVNCAVKSFDDVSVRHFIQGAGKDKLADELPRAASTTTKRLLQVISEYPTDEGVIVCTFKQRIVKEVSHAEHLQRHMRRAGIDPDGLLPDGKRRFVFLTWGRHVGVSEYAYCQHTLAVGVLRREGLDIAAHMAGQQGSLEYPLSADPKAVADTVNSEMFHHVIQFAGRGACRTTTNGKAGRMSLTLFCSVPFPPAWWDEAMPGVKVAEMRPDAAARVAKASAELDVLRVSLEAVPKGVDWISASALKVQAGLQSMHSMAYSRLLSKLNHCDWRRAGRGLERVPMFMDETITAD